MATEADEPAVRTAESLLPITFPLANQIVLQVTLDAEKNEATVMLHGPKCGELIVLPSAGNSIKLRATGRGVALRTPPPKPPPPPDPGMSTLAFGAGF